MRERLDVDLLAALEQTVDLLAAGSGGEISTEPLLTCVRISGDLRRSSTVSSALTLIRVLETSDLRMCGDGVQLRCKVGRQAMTVRLIMGCSGGMRPTTHDARFNDVHDLCKRSEGHVWSFIIKH